MTLTTVGVEAPPTPPGEATPPARRPLWRWVREDDLPLFRSKFARILELCEDRDVLDVGCVGGRNERIEESSHARLAAVSRYCVGIDIVADEIDRRRAAGYNVEFANAEDFHLGHKFDVIVAADLIEHLASPGRFLERAREHLRPSGVLCLVTPNALSLNNAFKSLAGLQVAINPEHTCWFDRSTLRELLRRCGFGIVEEYWQDYLKHPLTAIFLRFRKNLASHLIVIARPLASVTP
jgi:SAM-dependent methyltransferase